MWRHTKSSLAVSLDSTQLRRCWLDINQCFTGDTAVQALQESLKCVSKSQRSDKVDLTASLNQRVSATSAFLEAQSLFSNDPAAAVQICNGLIVQVLMCHMYDTT